MKSNEKIKTEMKQVFIQDTNEFLREQKNPQVVYTLVFVVTVFCFLFVLKYSNDYDKE